MTDLPPEGDQGTFRQEVLAGLTAPVKTLLSKYFYDAHGDAIFQEIMALEEYYLTRCELEILRDNSDAIIDRIGHEHFDIIELGAGDGTKAKVFLSTCLEGGRDITYIPVDISPNVLALLKESMAQSLPMLDVQPCVGEYLPALEDVDRGAPRRLLMFLGSTIGNFSKSEARKFVGEIGSHLRPQDFLLMGIDIMKDPRKILAAYNDPHGVTKRFNLNLLRRINRELGADFEIDAFDHYATYDPLTGTAASFLVSLKDQEVTIDGTSVPFGNGEVIHTEVSMKYGEREIAELGKAGLLQLEAMFMDAGHNYCLALFHKETTQSA